MTPAKLSPNISVHIIDLNYKFDAMPLAFYISITFLFTAFGTGYLFYLASAKNKTALMVMLFWIVFQSILAILGFYQDAAPFPPRVMWMVMPALLFIFFLFITPSGRTFLDTLQQPKLTLLHTVRIPVEIVLYLLAIEKLVPDLMTFNGSNPDILSGLSAPLIFLVAFVFKYEKKWFMLSWNLLGLILLFNIVIRAALSVETPFQQMAFEQPNKAILLFPFNLLPSFVVPLVLLSHLSSIRHYLLTRSEESNIV